MYAIPALFLSLLVQSFLLPLVNTGAAVRVPLTRIVVTLNAAL
jgi:hypothetical protein